jgi:hypothetical protein
MEIIGRRHYGRKAVPAGGGGGKSAHARAAGHPAAVASPRVQLDANGQATGDGAAERRADHFRIVAVADAATGLFGTGQTTIACHAGPADHQRPAAAGARGRPVPRPVHAAQHHEGGDAGGGGAARHAARAAPQTVDIPAGEAREVAWTVTAPRSWPTRAEALLWEVEAKATAQRRARRAQGQPAPDSRRAADGAAGHAGAARWPFNARGGAPADALPNRVVRGGLRLALQPKLAEGLPGVRDWSRALPVSCLEQKTSKAIGLRDTRLWQPWPRNCRPTWTPMAWPLLPAARGRWRARQRHPHGLPAGRHP